MNRTLGVERQDKRRGVLDEFILFVLDVYGGAATLCFVAMRESPHFTCRFDV